MKSADEDAGYAEAESSVRGVGQIERGAVAKPKFVTETIKLDGSSTARPFDWQACIKEHPYLTLGLAAGAGMLLVGLLKPRPTAKKRLIKTLGNNVAGASRQLERGIGGLAEKPARVATSVKAAAATMATKALKNYLQRKLINTLTPGRKRRLFS